MNGGLARNNYEYQSAQPVNNIYGSPMKTYSSSQDIPHMSSFDLIDDAPTPLPTHDDLRRSSIDDSSEYSRPYRPVSRPKTPPPPPPPLANSQSMSRWAFRRNLKLFLRLSNISSPHQYTVTSSRETVRVVSSPAMSHVSSPVPSVPHVSSAPAMTSSPAPPPPPPPSTYPVGLLPLLQVLQYTALVCRHHRAEWKLRRNPSLPRHMSPTGWYDRRR